jgi:hypothetical protein
LNRKRRKDKKIVSFRAKPLKGLMLIARAFARALSFPLRPAWLAAGEDLGIFASSCLCGESLPCSAHSARTSDEAHVGGRRLSGVPAGADAASSMVTYSRCQTATALSKKWEFIQDKSREAVAGEFPAR